MKKLVLIVIALFIWSADTVAQVPPAKGGLRSPQVVNLMPAFWEFEAAARGVPVDEQAGLFRKMVIDRYPEVYTKRVLGFAEAADLDEALKERYGKYLARVGPHMGDVRTLSAKMDAELARGTGSLRKAFPDLDYGGEIYFLNSLGAFDGATRMVKGKTALLFGVEMLATLFGPDGVGPMFHHELFHIYHHGRRPAGPVEKSRVWEGLWGEGLALHVAKTLNPDANEKQIFGFPEDTPSRAEKMLPQLAQEILDKLDSDKEDDYKLFFRGDSASIVIPKRSGYYVGYKVAAALGKRRSLRKLAGMDGPALRAAIKAELLKMTARR